MVITATLFIMIVIALFSIILGGSFTTVPMETVIDNEVLIDGITRYFELDIETTFFNIDPVAGAIVILTVILALVLILGIQILGSGLSPQSVKIGTILTIYIGLWIILSALASSLIKEIELFGSVIYITLTIAYTVGVFQKISGSD